MRLIPPSAALCQECKDIFTGASLTPSAEEASENRSARFRHHSIAQLIECGRRLECALCVTLFGHLRGGRLKELEGRSFGLPQETRSVDLGFSIEHPTQDGQNSGIHLADFSLWPQEVVLPYLKKTESVGLRGLHSTSSSETFDFLLRKLAECDASHTRCLAGSSPTSRDSQPFMPRRLVNVGGIEDKFIRIQESVKCEPASRYATLSHTWGKAQIVTLCQDFADVLETGIDLDILPRTFRDAIAVTRRLRIPFLWIDSLCIMQDSKLDWDEQAPQMQYVYKYAYLNISASLGEDSHSGLFRVSGALSPFPVETTWGSKTSTPSLGPSNDSLGPEPGSYYCVNPFLWRTEVEESPLSMRAWVMQERLLSPRVCHFGDTQVYWQCQENRASEIYPDSEPMWSDPFQSALSRMVANPHSMCLKQALNEAAAQGGVNTASQRTRLYLEWYKFLESYSMSRLTFDRDIFMALEGIAREFQDATGDRLVMGLWRSRLPENLCWSVERDSVLANSQRYRSLFSQVRPSESVAPTWSWAATRVPVCYSRPRDPMTEEEDMLEVLAVEDVEYRPGCFEPRLLRVRGHIYTGFANPCLPPRVAEMAARAVPPRGRKKAIWMMLNPKLYVRAYIELDDTETLDIRSMQPAILLPVCKYQFTTDENVSCYHVDGLILAESRLNRGLYFRRGFFCISDFHPIAEMLNVKPFLEPEYEERCLEGNKYIISII